MSLKVSSTPPWPSDNLPGVRFRAFAAVSALALEALAAGCFVYNESLLEPTGGGGAGGGSTTTTTGMTGTPCSAPEDCPDPGSACKKRLCTGGFCATENLPPNTPVADPVAGDCRGIVCDSAGGELEVEMSSDIEDDSNPCTQDLCKLAEPVHEAILGKPCGTDVCNAQGECVECVQDTDCASEVCKDEACAPATCSDNTKNGSETDTDCGGACAGCLTGKACEFDTDCKSGVCESNVCSPSCTDGAKNNAETDIDCGGVLCAPCGDGQGCSTGSDCQSAICTGMACAVPTCSDGQKNGMETAIDCGGPTCPSCPLDHLVINEIDYDQPNADLLEFVEIYNATVSTVSLANMRLVLVNGGSDPAKEYRVIDLSPAVSLLAGQYLVVGVPAVAVAPGALKIDFPGIQDMIQNGAPDGVALVDVAAVQVVDALSYEGGITIAEMTSVGLGSNVNLVEGVAASATDNGAGSLCRIPSSKDTDNAAADWALSMTPTPGEANVP